MKGRLTVTVDADLIPEAKHYARERGLSLSSLVEDMLREAASKADLTFVERWGGKFKLDPEDYPKDDPRFEYLARKYLT